MKEDFIEDFITKSKARVTEQLIKEGTWNYVRSGMITRRDFI